MSYEAVIRDAVRWMRSQGHALPVVWYRGQPEASLDELSVRVVLRSLALRIGCLPWQARVVRHQIAGLEVTALAVSLEPIREVMRAGQ